MGTGVAVATGDLITAAKMNLKQETGADLANISVLDQSGAGTEHLAFVCTENLSANRNLTITVNDADRTINLAGNLTLAAAFTTATAAITLTANAAGSAVTLPASGTLATLTGAETFQNKTYSGTLAGAFTLSGATITLTGGTLNLTAGAGYVVGTTDNFALTIKTNAVNKLAFTTTLGQLTVYQATANYTVSFSDPAAGRIITFADPLGNDTVAYLAATQSFTNKTLAGATFSGTIGGAHTYSGALTLTASPLNFTAGGAFTLGTTDANTLIVKTGNATRWTFAAASSNLTAAGAAAIAGPAATATALTFTDGTTAYISVDTRVAVDNIAALTLTGSAPTIVSAAGTTYSVVSIPAVTITLTGGVGVTAMNGVGLNLARPTITSGAATTIATASTLYIANSPLAAGAGPAAITNAYSLHVAAGTTQLQATNVAGTLTLTNATFNITAGGAATLGTTDANTLAFKTGGTTRYTIAAASANVTLASAALWAIPANTAASFSFQDGTTSMVVLDSRNTITGVLGVTLTGAPPTIVSAAGTTWSSVAVPAVTVTLTGGVGVTALNGVSLNLAQPTVTSGAATTVTTASTLYIANAPAAAGAGPAAITNAYALHVAAGITQLAGAVNMGGVVTHTNATLNFTAGGAVTIGTTDANTLAFKTQGTTRLTIDSATALFTISGAGTIACAAASSGSLSITDGTTSMLLFDSRVAVDNVSNITWTAPAPTIVSAAGTTWRHATTGAVTVTLTGGVGVTAMNGLQAYFDTPTLTSGVATTVGIASTIYIRPPVAAGAGPVTITNNYMINTSVAGCFLTAAGVWTDASSIETKQNIKPFDLARVPGLLNTVDLVSFRKRDSSDGGFERVGVIAENAPDFMASSDHKGIGALYMAGFTLAAVKYLKQENESLKAELHDVKSRLAAAGID